MIQEALKCKTIVLRARLELPHSHMRVANDQSAGYKQLLFVMILK